MKQPEVIWMEVTSDKYELPVAVADSAEELAKMSGVKRTSIIEQLCRYRHGLYKQCKYRKIELTEDDE